MPLVSLTLALLVAATPPALPADEGSALRLCRFATLIAATSGKQISAESLANAAWFSLAEARATRGSKTFDARLKEIAGAQPDNIPTLVQHKVALSAACFARYPAASPASPARLPAGDFDRAATCLVVSAVYAAMMEQGGPALAARAGEIKAGISRYDALAEAARDVEGLADRAVYDARVSAVSERVADAGNPIKVVESCAAVLR